jgi:hypothetical protein
MYLCGAKHCIQAEDKRKAYSMIKGTRDVIESMGKPGCCAELLTCTIQWGILVNGTGKAETYLPGNDSYTSQGSNSGGIVLGNSNPLNSNSNTYNSGDADVDAVVNSTVDLLNQLSGGGGLATSYGGVSSYNSGDADVDAVVNGTVDLLNQLSGGGGGLATSYGGVSSYNSGDADVDAVVNGTVDLLNQLSGGGGLATSYGGVSSYNSGDADVDAVVNGTIGLLNELGGGSSYIGDSYAGGAAISGVLDLFGSALNDNGEQNRLNALAEEKRRQEAARLQEQVRAQEQAYALENKRIYEQKQRMAAERKALITKYPDGIMPLSYPDISESEIYFFVYRSFEPAASTSPTNFTGLPIPLSALKKGYYYLIEAPAGKYYVLVKNNSNGMLIGEFRVVGDPSNTWYSRGGWVDAKILNEVTEQEAKGFKAAPTAVISGLPEISISNVFSVSRFSDNSWPFKSQMMEKLNLPGNTTGMVLSGYYTNRSEAEANHRFLTEKSKEYGYLCKSIAVNTNASAKAPIPGNDYTKQPDKSTDMPSNDKPKLDFWDNSVEKPSVPSTGSNAVQEAPRPNSTDDFWNTP